MVAKNAKQEANRIRGRMLLYVMLINDKEKRPGARPNVGVVLTRNGNVVMPR